MIEFSGPTVVTLYLDAMGFLSVLGLAIISRRLSLHSAPGDRLFLDMCISVMLYAVFNGAAYCFTDPALIISERAAVVLRSVAIAALLVFSFQWLLYVDFMIFGSRDYLFRIYKKHAIPLAAALLMLLINVFTSIAFEPLYGGLFDDKPLYFVLMLPVAVYFIYSILMAKRYSSRVKRLHFFHAKPMALPFAAGLLLTLTTPYSAAPLGSAMGLTCIYFSLVERWRYEDSDTGFYNRAYMKEIMESLTKGDFDYRAAIIFEAKAGSSELVSMLKQLLPRNGEVVRLKENRFLLLLENGDKSLISWITGKIRLLCDKYDRVNPGNEIELCIYEFLREKDESQADFLKRLDDKAKEPS